MFISDVADTTIAMQVDISTSVQQGTTYDNASVDHQHGFMIISLDKTLRVMMNSAHCFSIWSGTGTGLDDSWTLLQELDVNGLSATRLFQLSDSTKYVIIGNSDSGNGIEINDSGTPTGYLTANEYGVYTESADGAVFGIEKASGGPEGQTFFFAEAGGSAHYFGYASSDGQYMINGSRTFTGIKTIGGVAFHFVDGCLMDY
jgi:hypothetical protein